MIGCGAEQPSDPTPISTGGGFSNNFGSGSGGSGQFGSGGGSSTTTGGTTDGSGTGGQAGTTTGGVEPGTTDGGTGTGGSVEPPFDPNAAPSGPLDACDAVATGVLQDDTAPINYAGNPVYVTATHAASGCLTGVTLEFWKDNACPMSLVFAGNGNWKLTSASIQSDPACGQGWGSGKIYSLISSTATLFDLPGTVANKGASKSCSVLEQQISLAGDITLGFDQVTFTVNLNQLGVKGMLLSTAGGGSCGTTASACDGVQCGLDSFGNQCGSCSAGLSCKAGQCAESQCPPTGPFGTNKGDTMLGFTLPDCEGNMVNMSEVGCGQNASMFKLFAGY